MKKIYYKVVISRQGSLFSSWICGTHSEVEYKVNKYVHPHKHAPQALCVFDSYIHAENYLNDALGGYGYCFKCYIGKEVKRPKSIEPNSIKGTIFADKVKLLNKGYFFKKSLTTALFRFII